MIEPLLIDLARNRCTLSRREGRLYVCAPIDILTPALLDDIRACEKEFFACMNQMGMDDLEPTASEMIGGPRDGEVTGWPRPDV